MKITLLLTTFIFLSFAATSQDTSALTRQPYLLTLAVDKQTTYEESITAIPYLFPNRSMQIYPGETVYLEVEVKDANIISMKAVKEVTKPSSTLVIKFKQNSDKGVHQSMALTVENPFDLVLGYEALMFPLKTKKFVKTSIYPVQPGLAGIEMWPDLITTLALGNWKFKPRS